MLSCGSNKIFLSYIYKLIIICIFPLEKVSKNKTSLSKSMNIFEDYINLYQILNLNSVWTFTFTSWYIWCSSSSLKCMFLSWLMSPLVKTNLSACLIMSEFKLFHLLIYHLYCLFFELPVSLPFFFFNQESYFFLLIIVRAQLDFSLFIS